MNKISDELINDYIWNNFPPSKWNTKHTWYVETTGQTRFICGEFGEFNVREVIAWIRDKKLETILT